MKKTFTFLVLLFALTPLLIAAAEPTFIVRDAEGKVVGIVLAQTVDLAATQGLTDRFPLWVARKISGGWIFLPLGKHAVWATKASTPFLYETDNCTGPALLETPRTSDEVRATVVFDTRVYWPMGVGSDRAIRSRGLLISDAAQCDGSLIGSNLCCTVNAEQETRFAAGAVGVWLTHLNLQPPFRLEQVSAPPVR